MSYPRIVLIVIMTFVIYVCNGQSFIQEIQFDKIAEPRVKDFIIENVPQPMTLNEIKPTLSPDSDLDGYYIQEKVYQVKEDLESAWDHYVNTQPGQGWTTGMISTELMCSKASNKFYYSGETSEGLRVGQVLFLNLKFLKGVYNLAMAFEITSINQENHTMEFSYIEGNFSSGKQVLRFVELNENNTAIYHKSYYRSSSMFRDHFMYPFFHKMLLNGFHRNMREL